MNATTTAAAPPDRYPWVLIGLLWVVAFLNAADRNILIAVLPILKTEFGLSNSQLALLGSVFFWVYAVGAFVAGRIGDSVRRTRVILYGLIFWSVATGASALASGFALLLALRGLVAVGESAYYPTATALIGDWHRPEMRSRALSIHQTAVFAGAGLGAVATGYIAERLSWHAPFLIFGAIGLIHAVFLSRMLKDAPIRHTAVEADKPAEPIGIVLRIPPAVLLCLIFALATGASTGVTFWAPFYVNKELGMNLANSAWVGAATINTAGFLSVPLGGLLADTLAKRTPIGRFVMSADFIIRDSGLVDEHAPDAIQIAAHNLPDEALVYLLGSRYCETDRLTDLAWSLFGKTPLGWPRVQAIVDYVHNHIRFDYEQARPTKGAYEAYVEKQGVCRDYAHLAIAFCRCMNIPARYCTGYLGDIGVPVVGVMDFSAWFEAFLGGRWYAFDARNNQPRIGRVLIARGRDASDVALSNTFGPNTLESFRVWADVVETEAA